MIRGSCSGHEREHPERVGVGLEGVDGPLGADELGQPRREHAEAGARVDDHLAGAHERVDDRHAVVACKPLSRPLQTRETGTPSGRHDPRPARARRPAHRSTARREGKSSTMRM